MPSRWRYLGKTDVLAGISIVAIGIGLVLVTIAIEINPLASTLSARFFPFLLALGLLICGVLTLIKGLRPTALALPDFKLVRIAAVVLPLLVYYALFDRIDFRISTCVYVLITMLVLGARRWQELLLIPPAVALGIYLLFVQGFGTLLPTWN